jgi:hypothetical protein
MRSFLIQSFIFLPYRPSTALAAQSLILAETPSMRSHSLVRSHARLPRQQVFWWLLVGQVAVAVMAAGMAAVEVLEVIFLQLALLYPALPAVR